MGRRSGKSMIKKREKLVIEFDERKRAEFLTGFKRRKDERRRKAKEEIQKTIKAEKKRIMKKKSEQYAAQMSQLAPELLSTNKETYDLPAHTVTVTEINNIDFTNAGGTYLGVNTDCYTGHSDTASTSTADRYHLMSTKNISSKQKHRDVVIIFSCGHCSAKHEGKSRKSTGSRHHQSFTHTLNKCRILDSAERRKLKQKQHRKLK